MSKATEKLTPRELGELVAHLADTASRIEPDDLRCLAQMHGWCEKVVGASHEQGSVPCRPVAERATTIKRQLELLILGEVTNVATSFSDMAVSVTRLAELVAEHLPAAGSAEPVFGPATAAASLSEAGQAGTESRAALAAPPDPGSERVVAAPGGLPGPYHSRPLKINESELDFVKGFVEEAREHIEAVESALLDVETAPSSTEKLNDLFRPLHTIKSMAGFLNLGDINCLTHEVETLLDQGRGGDRQITPALTDLLFAAVDILRLQVNAIGAYLTDPRGDTIPQPPVAEMITKLRAMVSGELNVDAGTGESPGSSKRLGEILVENRATPPEAVALAVEMQTHNPSQKPGETGAR